MIFIFFIVDYVIVYSYCVDNSYYFSIYRKFFIIWYFMSCFIMVN